MKIRLVISIILFLLSIIVLSLAEPVSAVPDGWKEVGSGSANGGGISNNSGSSAHPSAAVTPNNDLYIAWSDDSNGDAEIYVRRWNGSNWEQVGSNSASGGGISNNSGDSERPVLVAESSSSLYVAWSDDSNGNAEIYVRHWNGSSWEQVGSNSATGGGISNNSGDSKFPSIAITSDGTTYVAWQDVSGGNSEIYVRRWNGSAWEEVGTNSASGGGISNNSSSSFRAAVRIASDGTPYVAWTDDGQIFIRRWNGNSWEEIGTGSASGNGISNTGGNSSQPTLAIDANGMPYVAWPDESFGNREIYVRRWNGSSWEEVGGGSATGSGISNNSGSSRGPELLISTDGIPYIVWYDETNSENVPEIYIRRWNNGSWEEVETGSATGGGISENSGDSEIPRIAATSDGLLYVTWGDDSDGDAEIYVRQFDAGNSTIYLPIVLSNFVNYFEGPWEAEPNNTSTDANGPLISGQDYFGYPNDQWDAFSFVSTSSGSIRIDLDNHTGQGVQLQLYYQSTNNRVDFDITSPYDIDYNGAAGTYYIFIFTESGFNSTTPYTLQVTYP